MKDEISVKEAAEILGISEDKVKKMISSRKIEGRKKKGSLRIKRDSLPVESIEKAPKPVEAVPAQKEEWAAEAAIAQKKEPEAAEADVTQKREAGATEACATQAAISEPEELEPPMTQVPPREDLVKEIDAMLKDRLDALLVNQKLSLERFDDIKNSIEERDNKTRQLFEESFYKWLGNISERQSMLSRGLEEIKNATSKPPVISLESIVVENLPEVVERIVGAKLAENLQWQERIFQKLEGVDEGVNRVQEVPANFINRFAMALKDVIEKHLAKREQAQLKEIVQKISELGSPVKASDTADSEGLSLENIEKLMDEIIEEKMGDLDEDIIGIIEKMDLLLKSKDAQDSVSLQGVISDVIAQNFQALGGDLLSRLQGLISREDFDSFKMHFSETLDNSVRTLSADFSSNIPAAPNLDDIQKAVYEATEKTINAAMESRSEQDLNSLEAFIDDSFRETMAVFHNDITSLASRLPARQEITRDIIEALKGEGTGEGGGDSRVIEKLDELNRYLKSFANNFASLMEAGETIKKLDLAAIEAMETQGRTFKDIVGKLEVLNRNVVSSAGIGGGADLSYLKTSQEELERNITREVVRLRDDLYRSSAEIESSLNFLKDFKEMIGSGLQEALGSLAASGRKTAPPPAHDRSDKAIESVLVPMRKIQENMEKSIERLSRVTPPQGKGFDENVLREILRDANRDSNKQFDTLRAKLQDLASLLQNFFSQQEGSPTRVEIDTIEAKISKILKAIDFLTQQGISPRPQEAPAFAEILTDESRGEVEQLKVAMKEKDRLLAESYKEKEELRDKFDMQKKERYELIQIYDKKKAELTDSLTNARKQIEELLIKNEELEMQIQRKKKWW